MTDLTLSSGKTISLIGDPHLGRKFETGVPLLRRGERERKQLAHFQRLLAVESDYVVMMGDLFDSPQVAYSVVLQTSLAVVAAAEAFPLTKFIMMAGNHDLPRNLQTVGAFDLFEQIVKGRDNILVFRQPHVFEHMAFFPWEWGRSAKEQVESMDDEPVEHVFGHWDLEDYGGDTSHLCPTLNLVALFGNDIQIHGGHVHTPGTFTINEIDVNCTGSMQPYSHGEDPDGNTYVTLTLPEFNEIDPVELKDKCVRILLAPGEELPLDLDCMALTAKRYTNDAEVQLDVDVKKFQWSSILDDALKDVSPEVREFIIDRLRGE